MSFNKSRFNNYDYYNIMNFRQIIYLTLIIEIKHTQIEIKLKLKCDSNMKIFDPQLIYQSLAPYEGSCSKNSIRLLLYKYS